MNDPVFPLSLRDIKGTFVQGDRRLGPLDVVVSRSR